jgi:dihydrofolate reductase
MGKLIYSMITSADGYVQDAEGNFDWGMPDQESHEFITHVAEGVGTYLYGRRMYETMSYWESVDDGSDLPSHISDWARLWQATEKIVYSSTLSEVTTANTRLERRFDAEAVRALKESSERDLTIDGPTLAAHAIRAGLVDEFQPIVNPIVVGGGLRFFPDDVRIDLQLLDERRFADGVVYLRYAAGS